MGNPDYGKGWNDCNDAWEKWKKSSEGKYSLKKMFIDAPLYFAIAIIGYVTRFIVNNF